MMSGVVLPHHCLTQYNSWACHVGLITTTIILQLGQVEETYSHLTWTTSRMMTEVVMMMTTCPILARAIYGPSFPQIERYFDKIYMLGICLELIDFSLSIMAADLRRDMAL